MLYVTQDARIKEILDELQTQDYIYKRVLIEAPLNQDLEQNLKQFPFSENPFLSISARSRLTQRGIEVFSIHGYPFILTQNHTIEQIVSLIYWAGESVRLKPGDAICRFYQIGDLMLDKQEIECLIESGELDLGDNYEIINDIGTIRIKPRNVRFVTHPNQPQTLTMEDLENNTYPLQPLEVDSLSIGPDEFFVTETQPISLPKDVYGNILIGADRDEPIHAWSPLIDPGFSGPLKLEFRSSGYETKILYGFLGLFRNKKQT